MSDENPKDKLNRLVAGLIHFVKCPHCEMMVLDSFIFCPECHKKITASDGAEKEG